ncbi:MAG: helix-turn-helix domain-containing protein [Thermoleophilia bacterium]
MPVSGKLTVADVIREESLHLRLVAGSRGLGTEVRGIHICEIPDPTPWLSRGDLLLTTGLAVYQDEALQVQLIRRLRLCGMAGLGVGVDIFMHETSPAMRAEAESLGLPLFEVPLEIPFKSITSLVFHSLHSTDFYQLRRSLSVQDRLLALLVEDRGLDHLVSTVAMLLSTSVIVFDRSGRVVSQAHARTKVTPELRDRVWQAYLEHGCRAPSLAGLEVASHHAFLDEVRLGGRVEQVICLLYPLGESVSEMGRVVADYVRKLLALELHRRRDEVLLQMRMRAGLLDDILSGLGRAEDLQERLAHFGFSAGAPLTLLVCAIADFRPVLGGKGDLETEEMIQRVKFDFKEQVDAFFSQRRVPFISVTKSDAVVVVVQSPSQEPRALRALGEDLRRHLAEQLPHLPTTVGFGESYTDVTRLPQAFTQAREAKDARIGSGESTAVRLFSDLGPRVRSLENQSPERLDHFVKSTVGPLIAYDEERGEHLLETLKAYLAANRNVNRAAETLYIHPNTLRNRLHRIEELLDLSLDKTDCLVDLALGLQSLRILELMRGAP